MQVPSVKWRIHRNGEWFTESTEDYFAGKRSLVVSLPGAFTPTCSGMQLPALEALYDDFIEKGLDEVYCLSVNDTFVMNAWAKDLEIENVKMIPDGSGEFTRGLDMIVWKPYQNFGFRSWRYAMVINDMEVENMWTEGGKKLNKVEWHVDNDPYDVTKPDNLLTML